MLSLIGIDRFGNLVRPMAIAKTLPRHTLMGLVVLTVFSVNVVEGAVGARTALTFRVKVRLKLCPTRV